MKRLVLLALLGVVSGYCSDEGPFITDGTLELRAHTTLVMEPSPFMPRDNQHSLFSNESVQINVATIDKGLSKLHGVFNELYQLELYFGANAKKFQWLSPGPETSSEEKLNALLEGINVIADITIYLHYFYTTRVQMVLEKTGSK
ncbi:MAG: hypothetical protein LBJ89_02885 [Holosporales bacterium]|jgi:hypothetical protein|nr:hypothetical protein [Holosporales bacterium]